MDDKLEKIKKEIEPLMNDMNLIFVDIKYVLENNYHFLRITLDKVNGY